MLKNWEILKSEIILKTPWFEIVRDSCQTPQGVKVPEYYTWKKQDCVIVFPVTIHDQVLLIKQYRHGIQQICIDYPGGTIEEGQSIWQAARCRLLEETGYGFDSCECIGTYVMDSSYSNQFTHFVVATGCQKLGAPSNPQKATEVFIVPVSEIALYAEENIDCLLCSLTTLKALHRLSRKEDSK